MNNNSWISASLQILILAMLTHLAPRFAQEIPESELSGPDNAPKLSSAAAALALPPLQPSPSSLPLPSSVTAASTDSTGVGVGSTDPTSISGVSLPPPVSGSPGPSPSPSPTPTAHGAAASGAIVAEAGADANADAERADEHRFHDDARRANESSAPVYWIPRMDFPQRVRLARWVRNH